MELLNFFIFALQKQKNPPSGATLTNYTSDIRHFIQWYEEIFHEAFDSNNISFHTIQRYKQDCLAKNMSNRSFDRHLSTLRKFFEILTSVEYVKNNPFSQNQSKPNLNEDPWKLNEFKNSLYEVYKLSGLSIKNYISDIQQFSSWVNLTSPLPSGPSSLTKSLLEEYRDNLNSNPLLSVTSVNRKLSSLRKYLFWLVEYGYLSQLNYQSIANIAEYKPIPFSAFIKENISLEEAKTNIISKTFDIASDIVFVNPIVNIIQTISYYIWKAKGQPSFYSIGNKKNSSPKAVIDNVLGNLQNSSYKPYAAPLSFASLPLHKKLFHHLRYTRPKWYKTYHSYTFVHYLHFAVLLFFGAFGAIILYQSVFENNSLSNATAHTPFYKTIPYQGTLLYSDNSPITGNVPVRFSLYEDSTASGSALLWEEVQEVSISKNGLFKTFLGNNQPIPEGLNNRPLWLGITVEDTKELKPRQQLPNVELAESSKLLNGLPVITESENNTKNVVLALDSQGDLIIGGNSSPKFEATDGIFTLSGAILSLETTPGSRGNIQFSPDGTGIVDIQKPIRNTSYNNNLDSAMGAVEIDDQLAVLATTSAQSAFVVNQNSTGPIISGMSSNIAKFSVDYLGNTTIAGNLLLQSGSASSSSSMKFYSGGDFTIQSLTNTIIDIGTSSFILSSKGVKTASFSPLNNDLNLDITGGHFVLANKNTFNIGGNGARVSYNAIADSTSGASADVASDQDLYVGGNLEIDGRLRLNNQTYSFPTNSGSNNYILSTNGSGELSWTDLSTHPSNYLRQANGATYLSNNSTDFLIGDSATSSAKFSFKNINSGTPQAIFTSLLSLNNPTGNTSDLLEVNSDIRVGAGAAGCVKNAVGSAIAGTCSSDARLKKNIEPIGDILSKLMQLTPSAYNWKADEFPEFSFGNQTEYGLIAQEAEQVFPELVEQNGQQGFKAVHYERLPIFLLAALKEQQQQIQSIFTNLTVDSINIATENITVAGKSFDEFLNDKLSTLFLTKDLAVGTKIISPVLESNTIFTNVISPLASDTVIINGKLAISAQTPEQEKDPIFTIRSASNSAVASFDGQGNATLAGTLTANRVIARTIDGLDETLSTLSATISDQNQNISSSSSELAKLSQKLQEISAKPLETASISSQFASIDNLSIPFATFTQGLTALGPSSLIDTAISGSLSIDKTLTLSGASINTLGSDLELQPFRQAGISFLSGLMRIDENGNLTVNGNAKFNQNIAVAGTLSTSIISPLSDSNLNIRLTGDEASASASGKLVVQNASGSGVLTIDSKGTIESSGSAKFNKLLANTFTLVRTAQADTSITETVASSSAGSATITTGETERTIITPYVNADSLIYLTPLSSSENITPFLARQDENSFTIRIPKRLYEDFKINWMIIN